jgi:hypothetical protein
MVDIFSCRRSNKHSSLHSEKVVGYRPLVSAPRKQQSRILLAQLYVNAWDPRLAGTASRRGLGPGATVTVALPGMPLPVPVAVRV